MPYVDAVVAVTVIRVLLVVFHVFKMRECESERVPEMMVCGGGCVFVVNAGHYGWYSWFRYCV